MLTGLKLFGLEASDDVVMGTRVVWLIVLRISFR